MSSPGYRSAVIGPETAGIGHRRRCDQRRQALHAVIHPKPGFLTAHVGGPATIKDVSTLRPADLRAFLAFRRKQGAGARSLGRHLAGLRSFLRHLERKGLVNAAGAGAIRSPKQPKSLPKPLSGTQALTVVSQEAQMNEEPWIAARDAAVLILFGILDALPSDHDAQSLAVTRDLDVLLLARATTLRAHPDRGHLPVTGRLIP